MKLKCVLMAGMFAGNGLAAASPEPAAFDNATLDVPSVFLGGATQEPVATTSVAPKPTRATAAPPVVASDMPAASPRADLEFKGIVKTPDPDVDYKLKVLEVEVTTRPLRARAASDTTDSSR